MLGPLAGEVTWLTWGNWADRVGGVGDGLLSFL